MKTNPRPLPLRSRKQPPEIERKAHIQGYFCRILCFARHVVWYVPPTPRPLPRGTSPLPRARLLTYDLPQWKLTCLLIQMMCPWLSPSHCIRASLF